MLLKFTVSNFKSIRGEEQLSFIAAPYKDGKSRLLRTKGYGYSLLPAAAIYGANASGKSNVINAIKFFDRVVAYSHSKGSASDPIDISRFEFDQASRKRAQYFELDFIVEGVRHQYGFALDSSRILEEWLYSFPTRKRRTLFTRDARAKTEFKFGRNFSGPNQTVARITRPNSLFLSAGAQNNHPGVAPVYNYISNKIWYASESDSDSRREFTSDLISRTKKKDMFVTLMAEADLGIDGISVDKKEIDREKTSKLFEAFVEVAGVDDNEISEPDGLSYFDVKLHHRAGRRKPVPLDFEHESKGTAEYYALIGPILWALGTGGVLIVDELERSLHPMLAQNLISLFNNKKTNNKSAQLLFTTHSTNLLASDELRRDQVWLTEKNDEGATHLYSLAEFQLKGTENLERGYLQGRFGAIPFLGNLDRFSESVDDSVEAQE